MNNPQALQGRFFGQVVFAIAILLLVTLISVGSFFEEAPIEIEKSKDVIAKKVAIPIGETVEEKSSVPLEPVPAATAIITKSPVLTPSIEETDYFTGIVKALENARDEWYQNVLYIDYGKETFHKFFYLDDDEMKEIREQYEANNLTIPTERMLRGFLPASPGGISTNRLRRKLKIKILQQKLEGNVNFIWTTGGHSASAGHGNLYNETYTAYLGRDLLQVLPKIGWNVETRNYAMGGMGCGSELGLCMEQVYGNDFDFLSWDFGMTDGGRVDNLLLYFWRANLVGNYPILFQNHGDDDPRRKEMLKRLEDLGAAAFYNPAGFWRAEYFKNIPLTTADNFKSLPKLVQYFKCMDGETETLENGFPNCKEEKYSKEVCAQRPFKADWHPGFKWHAMFGRVISLFLVSEVIEAAKDLATFFEGYDPTERRQFQLIRKRQLEESKLSPKDLLTKLEKEEKEQYERLLASELPEQRYHFNEKWKGDVVDKDGCACSLDEDFDQYRETMFRGPGICHIALLPSRTRYLGYLLSKDGNDLHVGGPVPAGEETYDVGEPFPNLNYEKKEESVMQLLYEIGRRKDTCPVTLHPDYKDYFFAHELDGWAKLRWPNKAEKEAYSYDPNNIKGLIGLSFIKCDWGKCSKGYLGQGPQDFNDGKFEITINGERVTKMMNYFDEYTFFLKGQDGYTWKQDPKTQDYEIAIRIKETDSYVKIGTFYLF